MCPAFLVATVDHTSTLLCWSNNKVGTPPVLRRQTPAAIIASARIGIDCAFNPAMFMRLSPTM